MKKIIFSFLLLLLAATVSAQYRPWEELHTDSADFVKNYGTAKEYQMQENFRIASGKEFGYRCLLVGMKAYWIRHLNVYMQRSGYNEDDYTRKGNDYIFYYSSSIAIGKKPDKFSITMHTNNDGRISGISVKGNADPLIKMFVGYWGSSAITLNELKSKGELQSSFLSDKITFKWNGGNPVIHVSKI